MPYGQKRWRCMGLRDGSTVSGKTKARTHGAKGSGTTQTIGKFIQEKEHEQKLHRLASDAVKLSKNKLQRVSSEYVGLFPTCTWDLETSNLNASIGFLLCCVVKPWGMDP